MTMKSDIDLAAWAQEDEATKSYPGNVQRPQLSQSKDAVVYLSRDAVEWSLHTSNQGAKKVLTKHSCTRVA